MINLKLLKNLTGLVYLNITSGILFMLLLQTLSLLLLELGYSKTIMGMFTWVTLGYSLKFFLGMMVAKIKLPFLTKIFGYQRAWLILVQLGLFGLLFNLPSYLHDLNYIFYICFLIGVFGALQDVLLESFRVDKFLLDKTNMSSTYSVIGYRLGMFIGSCVSIIIANYYSWEFAYKVLSLPFIISPIATILLDKPAHIYKQKFINIKDALLKKKKLFFHMALFLISFKSIDICLNSMNIAMLVDLGFSDKQDIAFYVKIPSLIAILIGAYLANKSIEKIELIKTLRISFYSQFIVLILFVNLVIFGVYTKIIMVMLMLALYIMSGFMQVSLLYLFTIFSKGKNSLIVFALISSISSLSRNILTNTFGFLSDLVGWHSMLLFAGLLAIPSLYMLYSFISYDYNKSLIKIKNENL